MSFKLLIHKKKNTKTNSCPLSVGAFLAVHSSVLISNFLGKSQTDLFDVSLLMLRIYIGRHVGGQEHALQHGSQYKPYYFAEKSKCHKISPLNAFPLKFRV